MIFSEVLEVRTRRIGVNTRRCVNGHATLTSSHRGHAVGMRIRSIQIAEARSTADCSAIFRRRQVRNRQNWRIIRACDRHGHRFRVRTAFAVVHSHIKADSDSLIFSEVLEVRTRRIGVNTRRCVNGHATLTSSHRGHAVGMRIRSIQIAEARSTADCSAIFRRRQVRNRHNRCIIRACDRHGDSVGRRRATGILYSHIEAERNIFPKC